MNKRLSLRLDGLRALAALAVFTSHFCQLGLAGGDGETLWVLGRLGVVSFFVLSGFVIAHVVDMRDRNLGDYLTARLARLWSVFLPALVITAVLDLAGRALDPALYLRYPGVIEWHTLAALPVFVGFLSENAWFSSRWLSNGPMWSIAYEFWYYVLFGLTVYLPRSRTRTLLQAAALVLAGWKVLLLMPAWMAGVALYRGRGRIARSSPEFRCALASVCALAVAWFVTPHAHDLMRPLRHWGIETVGQGFHSSFAIDYVLAMPVIGLFTAMLAAPDEPPASGLRSMIGALAGCSFTVYLLHVPLILLVRAAGAYDPRSPGEGLAAAMGVLALCFLAARFTEHRKAFWRARVFAVVRWARPAVAQVILGSLSTGAGAPPGPER
jgi:peptidoglycan/LPS O-acetylase OafA/YrhL